MERTERAQPFDPCEKQQLEIGISVQNFFNTVYRDYLNRFRYYADDMGRNGSIRLKWKFGA